MSTYTILCLGDSYTIGEMVTAHENFPNQTIKLLNNSGYDFTSPEIIAKTGWTTNELQEAIDKQHLDSSFDFVTLLIGVNNQYRGESISNYSLEFESLLNQAIRFAGGKADHVIVLSIPDWGVTPFANNRNRKQIEAEINDFNRVNSGISTDHRVHYIDITPGTREAATDKTLLTTDGLHPSGKEYAKWAEKISGIIREKLR